MDIAQIVAMLTLISTSFPITPKHSKADMITAPISISQMEFKLQNIAEPMCVNQSVICIDWLTILLCSYPCISTSNVWLSGIQVPEVE
jgi:hypothetical protein